MHRFGGAEALAGRLEQIAATLEALGRGELAEASAKRARWRAAALRGEPVGAPPIESTDIERTTRDAMRRARELARRPEEAIR